MVIYNLYDRKEEYASVPIEYTVEIEDKREVYKCTVELEDSEMPEWLSVKVFEIPTYYDPRGVRVTTFSEVRGITNIDTALFIGQVHQAIFFKESYDAMNK